ncbi:3-oxoacyl-ACP reductase FabG [Arvimicrobium flavum]|uniref:3-oxoacyl-ACP reductase FabG n=1 Tax=Arvimicrobium flavum TaxID=3393320 RepID=UPI00237B38E2|nr:3-oxoacyl-ACP reductase FabG [Mesorhizobium shangrilense]
MELGIEGKTALVTGAAGGLGAAIAEALAAQGVVVAVADIRLDLAGSVAGRIRAMGHRAFGVAMDVTDASSVDGAFQEIEDQAGSPDILINNAGFTRDNRIGKMPESDWDAVVDVVLKGAYLCTKRALPAMVAREWGRIVSISSRAHLGNPGQANYSAAKAGLLGFTRAMALENGRFGITANAIAPGIIDTAAVRQLPHYERIVENAKATLPIRRIGCPQDISDAVSFLASERASYITGEVLHVTGGRY